MNLLPVKRNEYRRVLYSFMLIVLVTGVILTATLFVNFDNIATGLVQDYTVEELSQISYSTDIMFETSKSAALQYNSNPAVLQLLNYDNLDLLTRAALLQQISGMTVTMPYANSLYIYNKPAGRIYYNSLEYDIGSFPDQDIIQRLESGKARKLYPIPRKMPSVSNFAGGVTPNDGQTNEVYSFIYYDNTADRSTVINVSSQWLKDTIQAMNTANRGEIIILDTSGNVVLGNDQYYYLDNIGNNPAFKNIVHSSRSSGNSVQNISGQKYLVSYVTSDIFGWKYVRITPYEAIRGKLSRLLLTTLFIGLAVTLLALVGARMFSHNIYQFFSLKMTNLAKRYSAEKAAGYEKRQEFLRRILEDAADHGRMAAEFAKFNIPFDKEKGFSLILFKIDHYGQYGQTYPPEDRDLFAYGLVNILNELSESMFGREAVSLGNGYFVLLLNLSPDEFRRSAENRQKLLQTAQSQAEAYLGFTLSVVLGEFIEDFSHISASYDECREAMNYKIFYGYQAIISVERVKEIKKKEYQMPTREITSLVDNLLLGKRQETRLVYDEIVGEVREYSFTALQLSMVQLGMSIKSALEKLNILNNLKSDIFFNTAERIREFDTIAEMNEVYYRLFGSIIDEIETLDQAHKQEKTGSLVDQVHNFVKREYQNTSLNSEMIARAIGISSDYLRRQYKKGSGESVPDYINMYRLSQARDMLQNTGLSIVEVAQKTGFASITYFYTAFKKAFNITPGEFRSLNKTNHQ